MSQLAVKLLLWWIQKKTLKYTVNLEFTTTDIFLKEACKRKEGSERRETVDTIDTL